MKLSNVLAATLLMFVASASVVRAEDPRYTGYSAQPTRGLFGLPVPQQWTGARPASLNGNVPGNCPNGQCGTAAGYRGAEGYRGTTGYRNTAGYNGTATNCANGQCSTGDCPNGQCGTTGYRGTAANCPRGQCNTPGVNNRLFPTAQSGWTTRNSGALADPFRRTGSGNDSGSWTQRAARPVLDPVNDAFNSRYRRDDLDLNSQHFRGGDQDRMMDQYRPSSSSSDWNRPARRSMEAPVNSQSLSRI